MTDALKRITEDERPIVGLCNHQNHTDVAWVGTDGITEIVAYEENGEMAPVPWFAIKVGDEIVARCAAAGLSVIYRRSA